MATRRESYAKIPTEFDITRYEVAKDFDFGDWYINLMLRTLRLRELETQSDFREAEMKAAHHRWFNHLPRGYNFREGDGYSKNMTFRQVYSLSAFNLLTSRAHLSSESERERKYRDAVEAIESHWLGESEPNEEQLRDACKTLDVPVWQMEIDGGFELSGGDVYVAVDLCAPDEKLVDDFRSWLLETRQAMNIAPLPALKRRFTQADFNDWHEFRVLAYLDLISWARLFGHQLTNQQLGVALFPDEYEINLADRVRKKVAPLALSLARREVMDALFAQGLQAQQRREGVDSKSGESAPD